MKRLICFLFGLYAIIGFGQITFNNVLPLTCNQPPFNYIPNAELHDVFIVNNPGGFNDGYLLFGHGITLSPSEVDNPSRVFSLRCNNYGQLTSCNDYYDTLDFNSQFGTGDFSHMIINHKNHITGIRQFYDNSMPQSGSDFIDEYDDFGERISSVNIQHSFENYIISTLAQDPNDSTYIFVGQYIDSTAIVDNLESPGCLVKVDTLGNIIWRQTYANSVMFYSVTVDENGYWIVGYDRLGPCSTPGYYDVNIILIHTDSEGNEQDRIEFNGDCNYDIAFVTKVDDTFIFSGLLTNETITPGCDPNRGYYFTTGLAFNENASEIEFLGEWKEYDNWCNGHFPSAFIQSKDEGYIFTEFRASLELGQVAGSIFKLDSNLDSLWRVEYAYYLPADWYTLNYITSVQSTADSGFVCAGYIRHGIENIPNPNYFEPWIFKTDQYGCIEPGCQLTGLDEIIIGLENTMTVYPNPVEDIAHIQFTLNDIEKIRRDFPDSRLMVTDINGKITHSSDLQIMPDMNLEVDMSNNPPGVYFVHWTCNNRWLDSVKVIKP